MCKITEKTINLGFIICLLIINIDAYAAPDYAREKRWAAQVAPDILTGEVVYLTQKNQHKFLGIYTKAQKNKMAVIVVHGMGVHPNWGIISLLRLQLAEHGYTTFSIQMPILAANASYKSYATLFPDAVDRLKVAVSHLNNLGYKRITIVSHSNGSRMSREYLLDNPASLTAWAALSLTQGDTFKGIKVPILDLYGEKDLPHVLASAAKRKASFENVSASKQITIPNADHFFNLHENQMIKTVITFLDGLK